ncbi:unnamed protein product [Dicrocoelium dendriticum]|nr:unnamed protein product [Dicrocoelium dendriticum]
MRFTSAIFAVVLITCTCQSQGNINVTAPTSNGNVANSTEPSTEGTTKSTAATNHEQAPTAAESHSGSTKSANSANNEQAQIAAESDSDFSVRKGKPYTLVTVASSAMSVFGAHCF